VSRAADGKVMFGEYLPDLPPTDCPGLTEALNVLPLRKFYAPYAPLLGAGDALSERPRGGIAAVDNSGNAFFYVGTETTLQARSSLTWADKSGATYTSGADDYWRFVQFDDRIIGTNYADDPQAIDVGDAGDFADLALTGTAPKARQIGIIGRHVLLGDTNDGTNGAVPYRLQWCRIDDPTEWPTPGTSDALLKQAGEQLMPSALGAVTGIVGNDQFGLVFQKSGISRLRYVGGDLVFEVDTYEKTHGAAYPNAIVPFGDGAFFIAADGFYYTDGATVTPIGEGKFDQHFVDSVDNQYRHRVYGAVDRLRKLIYWAYPGDSNIDGRPNRLVIFNYREGRMTRAEDQVECLVSGLTSGTTLEDIDDFFDSIDDVTPPLDSSFWQGGNDLLLGFDAANLLASFSGEPGTAVLDGQEVELNPGLYTYFDGIKALVNRADAITVALGTRDDLADDVTYSADVAPTARTGFSDFRVEARYARCRVKVAGNFQSAMGVLYQARAMGAA
jgi:hypothetical protein